MPLQAELAEEKRLARIKNRTKMDLFKIYGIRLLITLLVMALLAGAIYAIIKSVQVSTDPVTYLYVLVISVYIEMYCEFMTPSQENFPQNPCASKCHLAL